MKVVITGASGLLGRAVFKQFKAKRHEVRGLAFSRTTESLTKLDLHDTEAVSDFLGIFRPDVVVHCAAERRPDVAEADPESARKLNVGVSESLAKLSNSLGFKLIYISTDYVFDGQAPEGGYRVDAMPHPTNLYGDTKLAGEVAILKTGTLGQVTSLRVPVLYGEAESNSESAINILLDGVYKASQGEKVKMDDWATRYPTLVDDIARVLESLATLEKPLPPIVHFSSQTLYTKYTLAKIFASLQGISSKVEPNFVQITEGPKEGETVRPKDCHLSNHTLESLGVDCTTANFEEWWSTKLVKA